MRGILYVCFSALLLITCTTKPKLPQELYLPAIYYGMLPCADCVEIEYELTLQENFLYHERRMYAGKSDSIYLESGRWYIKNDSVIVIEQKHGESTEFLVDSAKLIMLNSNGNRIEGNTAEMYHLKLGSRKNLVNETPGVKADPYASKRVAGIDAIATGNAPSWNLEIDFENKMHFIVAGGADLFIEVPPAVQRENQMVYISESGGKKFEVALIAESCTDMSGEVKEYRAICNYDGVIYEGCGVYLSPKYRLNGPWQLQKLLSSDLNIEQSKYPILIFDVAHNAVMGNNGCNTYNGPATITDSEIVIDSTLATTLMACEGTVEQAYMQQLNGGKFRYIFESGKLRLIRDDLVIMDLIRPGAQ